MAKAASSFLMGVFVLALAIAMWRLTRNHAAWAIFFVPGAFYIMRGWALVFTQ
jgi:hypothetical protein